jgi:DNA-binding CsgD family transcriptional regulator
MTNFHNIIHSIASASNECELRSRFMDTVGKYFEVPRWGMYLFDEDARLSAVDVYGIPNAEALRELEIALLVAQGLTNVAIAKQLWITHNSVKQALKRIFRKIDVSSRVEMVAKLQLLNNK